MKYTPAQYARAFYDLMNRASAREGKSAIGKFVKTLAANGDLSKGEAIIREFERIWREKTGREKIEVTAAREEDVVALKGKLKGDVVFGKDPEVLGGVKIKIGDRLIDNTIQARIGRLKDSLGV